MFESDKRCINHSAFELDQDKCQVIAHQDPFPKHIVVVKQDLKTNQRTYKVQGIYHEEIISSSGRYGH